MESSRELEIVNYNGDKADNNEEEKVDEGAIADIAYSDSIYRYIYDDDNYSYSDDYSSINSAMEVVGLAFSVVSLAGPLSKACLSGYELLRATTTVEDDAGDFKLRVDTEMGLLNLWIKHWVRNGRIRGSGELGEQVCILVIDILAKIGSILVNAQALQTRYGIQVRKGTVQSIITIESTGSGVFPMPKLVEEEVSPAVSEPSVGKVPTAAVDSHADANQSTDSVTLVGGKTMVVSNTEPTKKVGKLRKWLGRMGCIKTSTQSKLSSSGTPAATTTPATNSSGQTNVKPAPAASITQVETLSGTTLRPIASTTAPRLSEIDLSKASIEDVLAALESRRTEVESNLTKVQRLKWVMLDKEKASQLADELKHWNERLFALLPPRRLDPRGSKRNKHYTVPQRASPVFTGRVTALSLLEEAFFCYDHDDGDDEDNARDEPVDRQRRAVLYGLGGAGKTQIALKFAEENRDRFDSIFWINASTTATVEDSFREIAELLRLPVGSGNLTNSVKTRLAHLRDKNWLLIFDNADDIPLAPYLPQGNHGNILITSRNPRASQYLSPLDKQACRVEEMSESDAVELLLKAAKLMSEGVSAKEEEVAHARNIVKKLGYLALAIDQAGAYISNNGSIETYLDAYENFRAELLDMREFEASGYAYPVYQTWELSFKAVQKKSPAAAELLEVFGYLHYEGIPHGVFEVGSTGLTQKDSKEPTSLPLSNLYSLLKSCITVDDAGKAIWRSFHFDNAVNNLVNYSLVKRNDVPSGDKDKTVSLKYSIHPLVHCWIRDRKVDIQHKQDAQRTTIALLCHAILTDGGQTAYAMRSHLEAHIDAWLFTQIDASSDILGQTEAARIQTFEAVAKVYHEVGKLTAAESLQTKVVDWWITNLGPSDPETIRARTTLATIYRRISSTSALAKAEALDTETVDILAHAHGNDHPETLRAKLNLASTLISKGEVARGEALEREVISGRTRALGETHIDTAIARGNLGVTLIRLKRYSEAETEFRFALERRLAEQGDKHPGTLLTMGNLANALRSQGQHEEAAQLNLKVLETRKALLGENHHEVARAMAHYGYTLMIAGKLDEAKELESKALEMMEELLGSYHPFTMDTLSNLAQVLIKMKGSVAEVEADKALHELVERKTLIFGEKHPSTRAAVKLLVEFLAGVGRLEEAKLLEAEAKTNE